jgi:hypothetical protein
MEGVSPNPEGVKICNLLRSNKLQNDQNSDVLVANIKVQSSDEMLDCAKYISTNYSNASVMLLSTDSVKRKMIVCTIVPPSLKECIRYCWLNRSTKTVIVSGAAEQEISTENIHILEISYANVSNEYDPEKLVDQVRTNSFSFLRLKGVYVDPPEEKEFTFDDLDAM